MLSVKIPLYSILINEQDISRIKPVPCHIPDYGIVALDRRSPSWFILLSNVLFCLLQPQILQPISHIPNEPLIQGKLARTVPTGGHNDTCTEEERPPMPCPPAPRTDSIGVPHVEPKSLPDPEELSQLLSTHLRIQDNNENDSPGAGEQIARPTPESHENKLLQTPHPSSSFSPRVLQPPRLHKRVTLPALSIGGGNPKPGPSVKHKLQQILPPPPSRGLPCFSAGNHVVTRGRLVVRSEADPQQNASVPLGVSTRLPKPKIH